MKEIYNEFKQELGDVIDISGFLAALKKLVLGKLSIPLPDFLNKLLEAKDAVDNGLLVGNKGILSDAASKGLLSGLGVGGILGKYGDDVSLQLLQVTDSLTKSMADKISGAILSRLNFPEMAFLAVCKSLYAIGSDPNYNGKYLRNIALQKDLISVLKWLDSIDNITYNGSDSDKHKNDAITAGRYSCVRNLNYILSNMYNDKHSLGNVQLHVKEDQNYKNKIMSEIDNTIHEAFSRILVYGYTNFTVPEMVTMVQSFKIKPCAFGTSDKYFGCAYTIQYDEIDTMAPFYEKKEKGLYEDINRLAPKINEKYIVTRNNNIKRIYMYLSSKSLFGDDRLKHKTLAQRLSHKAITTHMMEMDRIGKDLIPDKLLKFNDLRISAIYDFTKESEKMLYDPKKIQYIRFSDTTNVPLEPENNSVGSIGTDSDPDNKLIMSLITAKMKSGASYKSFQDAYIKNKNYINQMEMASLLRLFLQNVKDSKYSSDKLSKMNLMEELVNLWEENGTINFITFNYKLVLPIVFERIHNGTFTLDFMKSHTFRDMLIIVKNELMESNTYVIGSNDERNVKIFTYMYKESIALLNSILIGTSEINKFHKYQYLYNTSVLYVDSGSVVSLNLLTDIDRIMIEIIIDYINRLNDGSIDLSIFPNDYKKLYEIVLKLMNSGGYMISSDWSAALKECMSILDNIIAQHRSGNFDPNSIPSWEFLLSSAIEKTGDVTSTTSFVFDSRGNIIGVSSDTSTTSRLSESQKNRFNSVDDGSNSKSKTNNGKPAYTTFDPNDPDQYWSNVGMIKSDSEKNSQFFDFDVNNPPPNIMNSIFSEIAESKGGRLKYIDCIYDKSYQSQFQPIPTNVDEDTITMPPVSPDGVKYWDMHYYENGEVK